MQVNNYLKIDKIAFGGYGIGKSNGKIVFVENAIPGDVVEYKVISEKSDFITAKISHLQEASPLRITPQCQLFDICGGCSYLQVDYENELLFKKQIIKEQIKRIAAFGDEDIPEIKTINSKRFNYRSHTRFFVSDAKIGFYRKNSNDIATFPGDGCLLLAEEIIEEINNTQRFFDGEVTAALDFEGKVFFATKKSKIEITERENEILYKRDIHGFFQANRFLRKDMMLAVERFATFARKREFFLDICCGCGFFSLPLAKHFQRGAAFEINRDSLRYGKVNCGLNNVTNLDFIAEAESNINPFRYSADVVVIDPPRAGISKKGRKTINAINPELIVYISCNPATFARDLKDFISNSYRLSDLIFIDMFPGTHHIEIISLLKKSNMAI